MEKSQPTTEPIDQNTKRLIKNNQETLISSFLLFQILFDQAQRSVKQQLHNFVKEWVNLQFMVLQSGVPAERCIKDSTQVEEVQDL